MKKKLRYLWVLFLLAGIIVGIIGIVKIVEAGNMYVPKMQEPGWFDASTKQDHARFAGIGLCIGGFIFLGLMGSLISYFLTRTPEDHAKSVAKAVNDEKRFKDELSRLGVETPLEKFSNMVYNEPKICEYCGGRIGPNGVCLNCGASATKSKKR